MRQVITTIGAKLRMNGMLARWKKQLVTAAVMGAILTIGSLSSPRRILAQVSAMLVQDVDQPARQPFQATVPMNGVVSQNISIPSGKRLVVDFVDVVGSAASTSGGVQPLVLLASSV